MRKDTKVTTAKIAKARTGFPCLQFATTGKKVDTAPITIHWKSEQIGKTLACTIYAVYKSETGEQVVDKVSRTTINNNEIATLIEKAPYCGDW